MQKKRRGVLIEVSSGVSVFLKRYKLDNGLNNYDEVLRAICPIKEKKKSIDGFPSDSRIPSVIEKHPNGCKRKTRARPVGAFVKGGAGRVAKELKN